MRNSTVKYPALLGVARKNFSVGKKLRCFKQRVRNGEKNFSRARFFFFFSFYEILRYIF